MKVATDQNPPLPAAANARNRTHARQGSNGAFENILKDTGKGAQAPKKGGVAAPPRQTPWPDFSARLNDEETKTVPSQSTLRISRPSLKDDPRPDPGETRADRRQATAERGEASGAEKGAGAKTAVVGDSRTPPLSAVQAIFPTLAAAPDPGAPDAAAPDAGKSDTGASDAPEASTASMPAETRDHGKDTPPAVSASLAAVGQPVSANSPVSESAPVSAGPPARAPAPAMRETGAAVELAESEPAEPDLPAMNKAPAPVMQERAYATTGGQAGPVSIPAPLQAIAAANGAAGARSAAASNRSKEPETADVAEASPERPVKSAQRADTLAPRLADAPAPATAGTPDTGEDTPRLPMRSPVQETSASRADTSAPRIPAAASDRHAAPLPQPMVIAAHSFPAPAALPLDPTINALAGAFKADDAFNQLLSTPAGLVRQALAVAQPTHTLKIELHPAELGMVTASLRLSDGQLSIELKPETGEAHRKLSSDTDSLVKSLQAMGFQVDKVSVLQPTIANTTAPRSDTGASAGRDYSSFQPGSSGGNGSAPDGRQSGRNHDNDGQHGSHSPAYPRERTGGDLFI